jgi:hypothetical protein
MRCDSIKTDFIKLSNISTLEKEIVYCITTKMMHKEIKESENTSISSILEFF